MPDAPVPAPPEARARMALALDVGDLAAAEAMARRLAPWFGIAKVGMELYAEAGPAAIDRMHELEFQVFADLKLYDIPTTVERAARALGRRGVEFLNFPAAGGEAMLRAGVAGLLEGARDGGFSEPIALAVTVLTSDARTESFDERLDAAAAAGCAGVVCSAHEVHVVRARHPQLSTMIPGIRLPGGDRHDQARPATPFDAIGAGADWLVIGRAVTAATDAEDAAATVAHAIADALTVRTGDS